MDRTRALAVDNCIPRSVHLWTRKEVKSVADVGNIATACLRNIKIAIDLIIEPARSSPGRLKVNFG